MFLSLLIPDGISDPDKTSGKLEFSLVLRTDSRFWEFHGRSWPGGNGPAFKFSAQKNRFSRRSISSCCVHVPETVNEVGKKPHVHRSLWSFRISVPIRWKRERNIVVFLFFRILSLMFYLWFGNLSTVSGNRIKTIYGGSRIIAV